MNVDEVIKIIDAIPQYIKYFYPGYITIYVYCFLRASHVSDSKSVIVKSVAISYIYSVVINKINLKSELFQNIYLILFSVFIAYIAYSITKSEITLHIFESLGIETTFWDNEIDALKGFDEGAWLYVSLKDDPFSYEGYLHYKEMEPGTHQYITLNGYRKYTLDKNGVLKLIDDYSGNLEEEVMIVYENIRKIEKRKVGQASE